MSDKILKLSQAQTLYEDLRERIDALPTDSDIPEVPVQDVQVNGTSILSSGVANIPLASTSTAGVVQIGYGLTVSNNKLYTSGASSTQIKEASASYAVITPYNQHQSAFYGLARSAGDTTQSASSNAVGAYTDSAKQKIQNMLGITNLLSTEESSTATVAHAINSTFMMDGKLHRVTTAIAVGDAVVVGTNCEIVKADEVFVKNTDIATDTTLGLVKVGNMGVGLGSNNILRTVPASLNTIKNGTESYNPIGPAHQHESIYFGLSKLAGVDLKNETVTVGTYPEASKTAIRSLIGATSSNVIAVQDEQPTDTNTKIWLPETEDTGIQVPTMEDMANYVQKTDLATGTTVGIVKAKDFGIKVNASGELFISKAVIESEVKPGVANYLPIVPANQHAAAFYGLAKAAGDTTQAASDNAVGTYTTEAKAAIHTMLGIDPASIAAQVDIPLVETVSSTTPTITGQPNVRYVCGEVSTISITPPASGSVDVIFESGSTATTMTVPSTVKWPAWFDAEALETNTTYEILITDGIYGSVMTWAT